MSLILGLDPDSLLQGGWPLALGWLKTSHLNRPLALGWLKTSHLNTVVPTAYP